MQIKITENVCNINKLYLRFQPKLIGIMLSKAMLNGKRQHLPPEKVFQVYLTVSKLNCIVSNPIICMNGV